MGRSILSCVLRCGTGLAVVLVAAGVALAEEGDERRFTWRPSVQLRPIWNDNIALTKRRAEDGFGVWALPRVELAYRAPAYELGVDGAVDVRQYTDTSISDEIFYRVHSFGEAGLLPGLTVRLSDAYTPQVRALGLPDDDPANLVQTNRAKLDLRYWREFSGGREVTAGIQGGRFDTRRFAAMVAGPGSTIVVDPSYQADFWEGAGYLELRNPLGDQHAGYVRGLARQRTFDENDDADHFEGSVVVGFQSHLEQGVEFDIAGGYGYIDQREGGSAGRILGRAKLSVRRPNGWHFHAGVHHETTVDIAGNDFEDTTGRLAVEKYFGRRTAAELVAFLSYLEGDSTSPRSNLFGGAEVKLRRQLSRRIGVSLAYRYWRNAGAFSADDLTQNRVVLALTYRH